MIIIGEKINSSIPASKSAIETQDKAQIISLAKTQAEAGADFIDINAGMFLEEESSLLVFLAKTVTESLGLRLSIDTPNYKAAQAAVEAVGKGGHIINSVTVEKDRLENMTALAREYGCGLVALCMQEADMPENLESRLKIAGKLVETITSRGIGESDIYIDPMLKPLGADENSGLEALETISKLHGLFPGCHISCGLSNLSFGLPKRRLINRAFAVAAISAGLDAAILDPLDKDLMGLIAAGEAIFGKDEYCMEYIGKCREGLI
ncbi:MAG TPA: dihydropteroate synthase [Clostridia bacterium]|nr:dihydropteroate synthase [Clostridia bacterium]